jgi:protein O-mannosyl-transferase
MSQRPDGTSAPGTEPPRGQTFVICLLLALAVWAVFGQTRSFDFVNIDDNGYVLETPQVTRGLSWEGAIWTFTQAQTGTWHPLTWLSHMLDCTLYGLWAGGHHMTNVALHAGTVALLFLVLRRMTGAFWRSAFVAAIFAIHPLRAESVAWVAERKDVLSGLFFVLTLWAYVRSVECGVRSAECQTSGNGTALHAPRTTHHTTCWYLLALCFFALGLMSKPMLVTVPFLLLLLDYWPLGIMKYEGRMMKDEGSRFIIHHSHFILLEKVPFLALSAVSCAVTVWAQRAAGAMMDATAWPLEARLTNSTFAYLAYLGKLFWPRNLAAFYPMTRIPTWELWAAVLVLAAITLLAVVGLKRRPWLAVGWFWYVGMLVPVVGLVQVGSQAMADRYTYLPQIGILVAVAWSAAELCARWRCPRLIQGGLMIAAAAALMATTRLQTSYWKDSESLWRHTIAVTGKNYFAEGLLGNAYLDKGQFDAAIAQYRKTLDILPSFEHACNNLGIALLQKGQVDEAMAQYQKTLQLNPRYVKAYNNLGNALLQKGQVEAAIAQFQKALELKARSEETYNCLGDALLQKGQLDEAISKYREALRINPYYTVAYNSLGNALLQQGQIDAALAQYQRALQVDSRSAEAHYNLGNVLQQRGDVDGAIARYRQALQFQPRFQPVHNNLGNALMRKRQVEAAIAEYERALEIQPRDAEAHQNLAQALRQKGQSDAAIAHYQQAVEINPRYAKAHYNLASALIEKGRGDAALIHYQKAVESNPDWAEARDSLGSALLRAGDESAAAAQYEQALKLEPDNPKTLNNLAWVYASSSQESLRNPAKAVELAQRANQLCQGARPGVLHTLAAAYARAGLWNEAVATAQEGLRLARAQSDSSLAEILQQQIPLYQSHTAPR